MYAVPYGLRTLFRDMETPGIRRFGHEFYATRDEALRIMLALDKLRREARATLNP